MHSGFITAKTEIKNKFVAGGNETLDNLSEIPDAPLVDLRPLAVRLAESEKIKEEEFAEKVRLANTLRGLDQDELDFLSDVDKKKKLKDKLEQDKLQQELQMFKNAKEKVTIAKDKVTIAKDKVIGKQVAVKSAPLQQVLIKRKKEEQSSEPKKASKIVEYSDSD